RIGDMPLWKKVERDFIAFGFANILIVGAQRDCSYMQKLTDATVIAGGQSRQQSLSNALEHVDTQHVLVSDVARCCLQKQIIDALIAKKGAACVVPFLEVNDTVYYDTSPIDREKIKLIQTPQLSQTQILQKALQSKKEFTDDSSAIAALGEKIEFIKGSSKAHKLTRIQDLSKLDCLEKPSDTTFVGTGFDTHAFEVGKPMWLCGVEIESGYGFKAHSDGDVAIHSIIDALLGACGMGDIGELYPDDDSAYKDADSKVLLKDVVDRIYSYGFVINNIDITVIAQKPRLKEYKTAMQRVIQDITKCSFVNIKATTAEKMGYIGRCEGVAVQAVASIGFYKFERE
ncbi:MAG: 2-C-methyl-D-erythritol 2,4-cyclodiphosphate synthase, partial [Campylobacterota bacterium]